MMTPAANCVRFSAIILPRYDDLQERIEKVFFAKGLPFRDWDDGVQEVMLHALGKMHQYDPGCGPVEAWISTIARNLAIDAARSRRRHPEIPAENWALERLAGDAPPAPCAYEGEEAAAALWQRVSADLSSEELGLLALVVDGHSYKELAEILGTTRGTVQSRLHRTRQHARDALEGRPPRKQRGWKVRKTEPPAYAKIAPYAPGEAMITNRVYAVMPVIDHYDRSSGLGAKDGLLARIEEARREGIGFAIVRGRLVGRSEAIAETLLGDGRLGPWLVARGMDDGALIKSSRRAVYDAVLERLVADGEIVPFTRPVLARESWYAVIEVARYVSREMSETAGRNITSTVSLAVREGQEGFRALKDERIRGFRNILLGRGDALYGVLQTRRTPIDCIGLE